MPSPDDAALRSRPATVDEVIASLDAAVMEVVEADGAGAAPVLSVALMDDGDLDAEIMAQFPMQDVYLLVGVDAGVASAWLDEAGRRAPEQRPKAVLAKVRPGVPSVRAAAIAAGVTYVGIHPQARWDRLFPLLHRLLEQRRETAVPEDHELVATEMDLFGLAQMLAESTAGMVSIEDEHSRVLAYSASSHAADELRILTILGRDCPSDYLEVLNTWGVLDQIRQTDDVIEVPEHPELNIKRRLVVSIRQSGGDTGTRMRYLGSIWVQEGDEPLSVDSAVPLRGAAAVAAHVIGRARDAPSTEGLLVQRLFGVRRGTRGGVDIPSVAEALGVNMTGPAAVVGLVLMSATPLANQEMAQIGGTLRLHASSFRRDALVTVIGHRAYVLLPEFSSQTSVTSWTRSLLKQLEQGPYGVALRAAVAIPVPDLTEVASARQEVDRVLDAMNDSNAAERVSTLEGSRTSVLLGEILDLVVGDARLRDPRLATLRSYDEAQDARLEASVEAYLRHLGDVRAAASSLNIHPNTLRYRIRRVQEISQLDLDDPADRLLLQIQLAVGGRAVPQS